MKKIKLDKRILMLTLLLTIIICELVILIGSNNNDVVISNGVTKKTISTNQETTYIPEKTKKEEAYTELVGYGLITIDEINPYIYLSNPEENNVYLSFIVSNDGDEIYETQLIQPGKMEKLDIYSCLNAGKHTLIYSINSYDLDSKELYWSGIKQEQEIIVNK